MDPVLAIAGWWLLFGCSHVALASEPIRGALVAKMGERAFLILYTVIASLGFAGLVYAYAGLRFAGPPGLDLAQAPWARPPLIAAIAVGFALMVGAFSPRGYWASPMMVLSTEAREPYGLERVTRHPFFAGLTLAMTAHALLADHLVGTVFFAGFAALSIGGSWLQAGKLLRSRRGYDRFLAATSAVPFAAILAGRQRFVAREMPWLFLLAGVAMAGLLRSVHGSIFDYGGIYVTSSTVGVAVAIGVRALTSRRASPA